MRRAFRLAVLAATGAGVLTLGAPAAQAETVCVFWLYTFCALEVDVPPVPSGPTVSPVCVDEATIGLHYCVP